MALIVVLCFFLLASCAFSTTPPYFLETSFDTGKTFGPLENGHRLTESEVGALSALGKGSCLVRLMNSTTGAREVSTSFPACRVGPGRLLQFVVARNEVDGVYGIWEEGRECGNVIEGEEGVVVRIREADVDKYSQPMWTRYIRTKRSNEETEEMKKKKSNTRWGLWAMVFLGVVLGNGILKGCQRLVIEAELEEKRELERKKAIAARKKETKKGRRKLRSTGE